MIMSTNLTRRSSNSGSGVTETGASIQCVNDRDPQIPELWCWYIERIYLNVHTTACVEIPYETVEEFVTEYLSENGWRN